MSSSLRRKTKKLAKKVKRAYRELAKTVRYVDPRLRPKKVLFDHLPKCGGSSVHSLLELNYPRRRSFTTDPWNSDLSVEEFKSLPLRVRHRYDLVKGHLAHQLLDYAHPDCLKVTVFREPLDRIVSHYYYVRRTPKHRLYPKVHESDMGLADYAESNLSDELRNWYTCHFSGLSADDAEKMPEESIAIAAEVILRRYDIVGFLDDLSSFAETLCEQANLGLTRFARRINATEGRPSLSNVGPSAIARIERANRLDIALYRKIRKAVDERGRGAGRAGFGAPRVPSRSISPLER